MKTLVFDTSVTGHHLEYIHHLYLGMLKRTKEHYIFVIPESFKDNRNQYLWPQTDHIIFDFLSSEEIAKMTQKNFILSAWNRSILVREKVKKHNVVLQPGKKLYACHTVHDSDDFKEPKGEIITSRQDSSLVGLKNNSDATWTAILPNGASKPYSNGQVIKLGRGLKINFGNGNEAEIV